MILTITLNPALDLFCRLEHSRGKKSSVRSLYWWAGGKGLNVSRALYRLDQRTVALGCLGGMPGRWIKKLLREEDICHDFIKRKTETRIHITLISQEKIIRLLGAGHPLSMHEAQPIKKLLKRYLTSASAVVLSGQLPPGLKPSFYGELIRLIQKKNVPCLFDSHGEPFRQGLKAKPFYIKPNLEEAEAFFGRKLNSNQRIKGAVRHFLDIGVRNVLISLGSKGMAGSDGKGVWLASAPSVKIIHTVGCGDAAVAGFLSAVEKGSAFSESLRWAVAAGTANTQGNGPGDIDKKTVQAFLKRVVLRRL